MKRYQYLDVARGFGLLLVIISHSCGLSRFLINYYIPLFFVVSGYIYKEGRSYKENIEHKAKRLLIPYFGYSAVLLAVYVLMGRTLAETKASAFGILYSRYCLYDTTVVKDNVYLFTVANGAMWYLTAFLQRVLSIIWSLTAAFLTEIFNRYTDRFDCHHNGTCRHSGTPSMEHRSCLRGNHLHDCGNPAWESTVLRKNWNIPLIAAVFVIYILTSCLDPGINMSIREYGIYGAFSVPFFIIVGLTGSLLCIWFGKLIENTAPADSSPTSEKYDLPARLPHLCLRSCRTYCIQIYRNSCAGGAVVPFVLYHALRITAAVLGCLAFSEILNR